MAVDTSDLKEAGRRWREAAGLLPESNLIRWGLIAHAEQLEEAADVLDRLTAEVEHLRWYERHHAECYAAGPFDDDGVPSNFQSEAN